MQPDTFERGWELQQAGDLRGAEDVYRRLLRTEPRSARVFVALGQICETSKRLSEAVAYFRQAAEIEPGEALAHFHLGNAYLQQRNVAEAEAAYRRCLALQPEHVEALVNLGFVLGEQNRYDEAMECYQKAILQRPDLAEIHHNLANALREKGRLEEALAGYDQALRLKPDYAKAHINRGIARLAHGDLDEALASLRRGVELQPDLPDAHTSLGAALSVAQRFDEAFAEYERALALAPETAEAHWNRSLLWLLQGDYRRGWPAYEWRWRCKAIVPLPAFPSPRWDGSPLGGRTILLHGEQGLGDTLHFVRYAPLVKERGGRVIVQCQNALLPLLTRTPGIDGLAGWGAPLPAHNVHAPLMSLPALFGTTLETIPAQVPYVFPDPVLVTHWKRQLAPVRGLRLGIAWKGSPRHAWDHHRSVPLEQFEPLARVEGVRLISLQKGPGSEQLKALGRRFPVLDLGGLLDEASGPFMDTAAVLANLDLVVCVDTALGHLAGAMGVRAWLALTVTADWRWLLGRSDSPWYPTLRLFRQSRLGDWAGVFARMAEELRPLAAGKPRGGTVSIEVSAGELLDKVSILRIKSERLTDPAKLAHVRTELAELEAMQRQELGTPAGLAELEARLREVNERLWQIEDDIRLCEREQDFGPRFVELARSVYRENDQRSALKRAINELLGSRLVEEKSYPEYTTS